jgi:hypothetical protein
VNLSWNDYLKVYWPIAALIGINALGAIYSAGYVSGQRSILLAAKLSAEEVKHG